MTQIDFFIHLIFTLQICHDHQCQENHLLLVSKSLNLTTSNSDGIAMSHIIIDIMREYEAIGYKLHCIVNDIGPKNQAV